MDVSFWRDLAVIWLSLFCLIGLVVPVVALYFIVRGVHSVHGGTQSLLGKGQTLSKQARAQVVKVTTRVDEEAIRAQSRLKRTETIIRKLVTGDR